ncbi:hypothetical protein ATORI0001_0724 [Lancefieldella rimae ATCC 49626]|uniref:Uncharacterized protein n=1 Tax=Lancefieldella rimae (strain ATCC 49626 / DSM 7090 / CCUG 31168 / NBRC 15546 / VPI D140H-11A) TaxID=553184 RepID=B9CL11_LANR4|nr:hypothetical protein ATORI0001_0724 [Lancefieldella rimae ATCC 49626]
MPLLFDPSECKPLFTCALLLAFASLPLLRSVFKTTTK